jgi:hypothetical protein
MCCGWFVVLQRQVVSNQPACFTPACYHRPVQGGYCQQAPVYDAQAVLRAVCDVKCQILGTQPACLTPAGQNRYIRGVSCEQASVSTVLGVVCRAGVLGSEQPACMLHSSISQAAIQGRARLD